MKRELRRDSRRYKENKAKLRRQKDQLLKRKSSANIDTPVRKLKRLTEGLPSVSKHDIDTETHADSSFGVTLFSSLRYNSDSVDIKRPKPSAFATFAMNNSMQSSNILNAINLKVPNASHIQSPTTPPSSASTSSRNASNSTSLTQSIVNKLPSIGHKFVGDTEELIMKNTSNKPTDSIILPTTKTNNIAANTIATSCSTPIANTSAAPSPTINSIRSTSTQQSSATKP